jgi:hypothetical protein
MACGAKSVQLFLCCPLARAESEIAARPRRDSANRPVQCCRLLSEPFALVIDPGFPGEDFLTGVLRGSHAQHIGLRHLRKSPMQSQHRGFV